MQRKRLTLFSVFTTMILLVSLVTPQAALAQDETPPPDSAPAQTTDEAAPGDGAPAEGDSAGVGEPVVTEEPVATDEPAATEESVAADVPAEEPAEPEEASVAEILEQVPDGTDVVVLDEAGQLEPLASQAAADTIVHGDPMWCPAGVLPGPGCTISFPSFAALIAELTDFDSNEVGAGTIYVESNYNATTAGDAGTDIIFDYGNNELGDLVFQGGWNGLLGGSAAIVGTSDLTGIGSLQFLDWGAFGFPASLTLRDIVLSGGAGLYIGDSIVNPTFITTANVALENVAVTGSNYGTFIGTDGAVTVTDGNFSDNDSDGLAVEAGGNITLNSVTANGNDGIGAALFNCGCALGDVSVNGGEFSGNTDTGLVIDTAGNVTINNDVVAAGNIGDGIDVVADGNITLDNVNSHDNIGSGAILDNSFGDGNVTVTNGDFGAGPDIFSSVPLYLGNGEDGLVVFSNGDITLSNVTANVNDGVGAVLGFDMCGCLPVASNVNIFSGQFIGNSTGGVGIGASEGVSIDNVWSGYNQDFGIFIGNDGSTSITNSSVFDNEGIGALVDSLSSITVTGSFFGNCFFGGMFPCGAQEVGGIFVSEEGTVTVQDSLFSGNEDVGLIVDAAGDITLKNVTADYNGDVGAVAMSDGNVTICGGSYSYNGDLGLGVEADGTVKISGNTVFTGNGSAETDIVAAAVIENFNCSPKKTGDYKLINVTDGQGVEISCEEGFIGVELHLPNGDSLIVPCPMLGPASLASVGVSQLPDQLPEGFSFISGLHAQAARDGLTVSFVMPVADAQYTILVWNGSAWLELGGESTVDGMFAVVSVSPGIYVLATE